jgi:hypothetical protein
MLINGVEAGPSVYEAARAIIARNSKKIVELLEENSAARVRIQTQSYANVLEAERIATQADPFQQTSQPEPTV